MKYRKSLSKRGSRKLFTSTARRVNGKNYAAPRRGGYRL